MTGTSWPARRIGDRIVCGRQVAARYVCQGDLATISGQGPDGTPIVLLDLGMVEDPLGSNHYRLSRRGQRKVTEGRDPEYHKGGRSVRVTWTRDCPHCKAVALVDVTLL